MNFRPTQDWKCCRTSSAIGSPIPWSKSTKNPKQTMVILLAVDGSGIRANTRETTCCTAEHRCSYISGLMTVAFRNTRPWPIDRGSFRFPISAVQKIQGPACPERSKNAYYKKSVAVRWKNVIIKNTAICRTGERCQISKYDVPSLLFDTLKRATAVWPNP